MWHGAWCWNKLTPLLRAAGHEVYAVTLTGLGERSHLRYPDIDLNTHIQDVVAVLDSEDLHRVILVGHSLSGTMALAVAERIPERLAHVANLDGWLPIDGKSARDLKPDLWTGLRHCAEASGDEWWVPPPPDWTFGISGADWEWVRSKLTDHPLKTWETPFSLTNPAARSIPRTYIYCTEGCSPEEVANQQNECARMGWQYLSLPTGYDAMITAPKELAELLLEIA
jgi:pimeloyl-ACP methyl ester carboxylesterase